MSNLKLKYTMLDTEPWWLGQAINFPLGGKKLPYRHAPHKKNCAYRNCQLQLVMHGGGYDIHPYTYCEGWARCKDAPDLVLYHAWLIDPDGRVYDPTPYWCTQGIEYQGLAISTPKLLEIFQLTNLWEPVLTKFKDIVCRAEYLQ